MPYTPPPSTSVPLSLGGAYSPPDGAAVPLALGDMVHVVMVLHVQQGPQPVNISMAWPTAQQRTLPRAEVLAVVVREARSEGVDYPALRYASRGFCSDSDDYLPSQVWEGRIVNDPEFSREASVIFWSARQPSYGIGSIDLVNRDGALDVLKGVPMQGRIIDIYAGEHGAKFRSFQHVSRALVARVEYPGEGVARIVLSDRAAVLDKPLQSALFAGAGNTALNGQAKPLGFGSVLSVPAILSSPSALQYDVADVTPADVLRVRDQGVELAEGTQWNAVGSGFELLQAPVGRITADVLMDAAERLPDVLLWLLARAGLDSTALDTASAAALDAAAPYALGWWGAQPITARALLTHIMDSYGGAWWWDLHGRLVVGRLAAPGEPTLVIPASAVALEDMTTQPDTAPGYSNVCAGQRNYHVHSTSEIAGTLMDPVQQIALDLQADYRVRRTGVPAGPAPDPSADLVGTKSAIAASGGAMVQRPASALTQTGIGTLLTNPTHIQTEATRWVNLLLASRHFYTVPVLLSVADARRIMPFDTVTITAPRFGLQSPTNLVVVGARGTLMSGRITLTLWG